MAVLHPLYHPDLAPFHFWKLKLALKGRRCGDISTIQEQSAVLCNPNSGEDSRHIYWGQSITGMSLVQKSVWLLVRYINWNICLWCDLHVFRMQLDLRTVERTFLDNVGAFEALLQLPEHMKLNPILCGWVSPMLETRIRGPCLVGDRGAQLLKAASVEVLWLLVDGPPGRDSVVMGDIQNNVWVILLSWQVRSS